MGYQALYRRYRPQTFSDLAGQDPIVQTLQNAVRDGRMTHAYLFTGPRGTGKTTTARILAKALNCQSGATPDPCHPAPEDLDDARRKLSHRAREDQADPIGQSGLGRAAQASTECPQCRAIRLGNHLDVIEIDAASNRGIDDIRSLQQRVQLAPVQSRCKVFIIDEAHMLTEPAWNAILKTLEEPPPDCVFVLATTEVHKVLATVISRCWRFDFRRIPQRVLVERLRAVAALEGIELDDQALDILAQRADGGLRDALSLLDQVSAITRNLNGSCVQDALGILPAARVVRLGDCIVRQDPVAALRCLRDILADGHDHRAVVRELLSWARNLMVLQLAESSLDNLDNLDNLDLPVFELPELREQAGQLSQADVLYTLEVMRETDRALRGSNQHAVWLEVGLLRLCDRQSLPNLSAIALRLEALEARWERSSGPDFDVAPMPPAHGEGGALEAVGRHSSQQDVFQLLYDALERSHLRSKSAAFKQYVLSARVQPGGHLELRTRKTPFYKEGSDHRRVLLEHARTLFGPDVQMEILEEIPTSLSMPIKVPAREILEGPPTTASLPAKVPAVEILEKPPTSLSMPTPIPGGDRHTAHEESPRDEVVLATEIFGGKRIAPR